MVVMNETDNALLNPVRFQLYLYLLRNGPLSASDITRNIEIIDPKDGRGKSLSKSSISKHCRILEDAGLLKSEASFKGRQGISKIYRITQKPRWKEFILTCGRDPNDLRDDVYEYMDELTSHPKYLEIVKSKIPETLNLSLIRQKEQLDQLITERKDEILKEIKNDPELSRIYEIGFGVFFKFLAIKLPKGN